MAYTAPYIDASGLHLPAYTDIIDYLVASTQSIYGTDIYLGTDSADYQMLSIFALLANDAMGSVQLAYNNRGPSTAVGSGLDGVIKINGITRKVPSYSTCTLILTGLANSIIKNCVASDGTYKWTLPTDVSFDSSGNSTTTATCQTIGAIQAAANTINQINTPTIGWLTVNNTDTAIAGQPVEKDSAVRSRQALSTALPSSTLLTGTKGAISTLSGVTRSEVYENFTDTTDSNGTPGHSITAVVEGGTDSAIAMAIYLNKGPGCTPNGTYDVAINDPDSGLSVTVGFYRLAYTQVYSFIQVHPLTGWTDSYLATIQTAIVTYLNSLGIGEDVTLSGLYAAAMAVMTSILNPVFSIDLLTIGPSTGSQSAGNMSITYNHAAQTQSSYISVTKV